MAFDFTKLDGYRSDMTAEEKLALLETYEQPEPDLTGYIKKETFDKTASDLAEVKRQLKAKQTEEEQKEADRLATEKAIKEELDDLRKENAVTKSKAEFMALGYDEVLAGDAAKALADGDMSKFNTAQKTFIENVKRAERAAALASDTKPPAGGGDGGGAEITKEQFNEMGYTERLKIYNEQPEVYKKLTEA
ncbi:MAG: hypothetical protein WDA65_02900 [Christensenellales bacterium]